MDLEAPAPLLPLSRPTPETVLLKARPKGPFSPAILHQQSLQDQSSPAILHQQSLQDQSSPIILHLPFKVLLEYVHHPRRVQQAVSRNHLQLPRSLSGLRFQRLRFQRLQFRRLQFRKLLFRRLRLRWLILQQQLQRHHRNVLQ